jgi:fumarate reductase flavoprotein subunit
MAGVTAMLRASELGARTLLLERSELLGGSTVLSGGMFTLAGTDEQREHGIDDSVEQLRTDILATGQNRNCLDLVDAYCEHQLETYLWLKSYGVTFGPPGPGSGLSVPRGHTIDTGAALQAMIRAARVNGAQVRYRSRARRLMMDGDRVQGVLVDTGDGPQAITAATVVIATGGFTRSEELLRRYAPGVEGALRAGGAYNVGDGLLMACKVGAAVLDTPHIKATFGAFPWRVTGEAGLRLLAIYKGGIAVNGEGQRFIDESRPYKEIGEACLAQPGSIAYQLFDDQVVASADPGTPVYNFRPGIDGGQVATADSWAVLADRLGLPPEVVTETVEAYNAAVRAAGRDAFGRTTLSGGIGSRFALDRPPYYGYATTAALLGTYGGAAINPDAQVLDVFGDPIPGLYAAGEVTGGFHGAGYVSGTSIGKAAIFGRISGAAAASEARRTHELLNRESV